MARTVLITGSSTGIGRETALLFQRLGWNVAATMRHPDQERELTRLQRTICPRLDVTDPGSIQGTIAETIAKYGAIDALVNNAGYAAVGPFEAASPDHIQRQFNTNVFGLMNVARAVLPHFRERRQGVLINVASIGGRVAFPLWSLYHATKWAVDGFTESLHYELRPFGVRVRLIEPGPIKTDFYTRSMDVVPSTGIPDYDAFAGKTLRRMNDAGMNGAPASQVAHVIYRAAVASGWRLRYATDLAGWGILFLRRLLPDCIFHAIVRASLRPFP
ncbi:MAG TPA: SDR family oxidoreductase [Candidatus Hydrogenedentes bacterium]|nr:SDR family oxidoreductase [Candidatus Hydrogenedentota bacterium]HOS02558.1 SDR family oxidoreductase [Candidatus Hydrogenedentota bacterium]